MIKSAPIKKEMGQDNRHKYKDFKFTEEQNNVIQIIFLALVYLCFCLTIVTGWEGCSLKKFNAEKLEIEIHRKVKISNKF